MNLSESLDHAATIREIYVRRQHMADDKTTMLAEELYGDAINGIIVPGLMELRALARATDDAEIRERLQALITDQRSLVGVLRAIADRLYPTGGLDDPLGLPGRLREQCARWSYSGNASCLVDVIGPEQPVILVAQRAAVRLMHAVFGLVGHETGRSVVVQLVYPNLPGTGLRIVIRADGAYDVEHEAALWHVRDIQESMHAIGGRATFGTVSEDQPLIVAEFPVSALDAP